jgi:hypothetical protein
MTPPTLPTVAYDVYPCRSCGHGGFVHGAPFRTGTVCAYHGCSCREFLDPVLCPTCETERRLCEGGCERLVCECDATDGSGCPLDGRSWVCLDCSGSHIGCPGCDDPERTR